MKSKRVKIIFVTVTSLIGGLAIISGIVVVILVVWMKIPVSKDTHLRQVRLAIAKAGGVSNVLTESKILFQRFSAKPPALNYENISGSSYFMGLLGITKLGAAVSYSVDRPDRIEVFRFTNSFDKYAIELLNPDCPEPAGFQRVAGNVGYLAGNPAFDK